jgi:hypothetical protein
MHDNTPTGRVDDVFRSLLQELVHVPEAERHAALQRLAMAAEASAAELEEIADQEAFTAALERLRRDGERAVFGAVGRG